MNTDPGCENDSLHEIVGDFLDESDDIIGLLNEKLLKLDEWIHSLDEGETARCDEDLMNQMFRAAHSLKGLSGMLGFADIHSLTHKVENVFDAVRNDQLPLTAEIVELIFQSVDKLTGMLDCLKDSNAEPVECEQVLLGIERVLQGADAEHVQVSAAETEKAFEQMQEAAVQADGHQQPTATAATDSPDVSTEEVTDHFADLVDETEISAKYLAIFIDESEFALDEVADALLSQSSAESITSLLIQCHKIKGSAASLGLHRAAKFAHFMEDLLQELRQAGQELTDDMTEAMLRCTDTLRGFVESLKCGDQRADGFNDAYLLLLASRLAAVQGTSGPKAAVEVEPAANAATLDQTQPAADMSDALRKQITALAPKGAAGWVVQVVFEPGIALPGLKASLAHDRISNVGTVFFCDPPENELEDLAKLGCVTLGVATEDDAETVRNALRLDGIQRVDIQPLATSDSSATVEKSGPTVSTPPKSTAATASSSPPTNAKSGKSTPAEENKKPTETLRVDIERLDHLMNLAGQLVINKARFSQISEGLRGLSSNKQAGQSLSSVIGMVDRLSHDLDDTGSRRNRNLNKESLRGQVRRIRLDLDNVLLGMEQLSQARVMVTDLVEAVHQLDRVTDGIQKTTMDTRMVPIGPLFRRFKRVIRDITHANGKDIQLVIRGEKTELDKRMIDALGDPLIHMIRNCADHGIEPPDVREAAGKRRQGTVTLNALHRGNSIVIEIQDDGKGLDSEKIRNKAIEKGIISAAAAEKLTTHQIFQMIWEPGLSTAEKVTEVSGRGMGMDIVRTKIEEINGSVELDSKVGEGTTITIKLPLTLAILPSLLVEIDGDVIAMPVESIAEIVPLKEEHISTIHGLPTTTVRGRAVSVVSLSQLFSWNQPPKSQASTENDAQSLVILEANGVEVGLAADRLLGEEDIVIKSMTENYHNVDGIAGASILGDGRVSLILDVGAVIEMAALHDAAPNTSRECVQ